MAAPRATLTEGPVRGHLVSLTVPMVWGIAAVMSLSIVDTWVVAQPGEAELAAMSLTFPVTFTLVSLGIGMMAGTAAVRSRILGQGDVVRLRRVTRDAAMLGAVMAVSRIMIASAVANLILDPLLIFGLAALNCRRASWRPVPSGLDCRCRR